MHLDFHLFFNLQDLNFLELDNLFFQFSIDPKHYFLGY